MSKIEQINEIYAFIKATVIDNECTESQARNILDSDVMSKLVVKADLTFPFQYSEESEGGIWFFNEVSDLVEYILEKLANESILMSDDYYESSDDWEYSSC